MITPVADVAAWLLMPVSDNEGDLLDEDDSAAGESDDLIVFKLSKLFTFSKV